MDKTNNSSNMSPELESFFDMLVASGLLPDPSITDEAYQIKRQNLNRSAYHQTERLLKAYRDCVFFLSMYPEEKREEIGACAELDTLVDKLDIQLALGNPRLQSELEGIVKARECIKKIDRALEILKHHYEGDIYYQVIYNKYICPRKITNEQLAEMLDLSLPTLNRRCKSAISLLSCILWGAPTVEAEIGLSAVILFGQLNNALKNNEKK